jgi:hypothetical protein
MDGASGDNGQAGFGADKKWIGGFSKFIGHCDAFSAELWGVLEGSQLAHARGFNYFLCLILLLP